MKTFKDSAAAGGALLLSVLLGTSVVPARAASFQGAELSVMGGIQALNENDTAVPDNLLSVPLVGTLSYQISPVFALEGEFTWMIPVEQEVEIEGSEAGDMKTPDILAYQANVRAGLPIANSEALPYLVAGAGAMTFLSNDEPDRVPQIGESQTVFAINFGAGVIYGLSPDWALRGDFRGFVAFPSEDTPGLSSAGEADEIWMERGTVGLSYRF